MVGKRKKKKVMGHGGSAFFFLNPYAVALQTMDYQHPFSMSTKPQALTENVIFRFITYHP